MEKETQRERGEGMAEERIRDWRLQRETLEPVQGQK